MPLRNQVSERPARAAPAPGHPDAEDLPPPGQRWGEGAHSVLPYLTRSLLARPAMPAETRHPPATEHPVGAAQRPGVGR